MEVLSKAVPSAKAKVVLLLAALPHPGLGDPCPLRANVSPGLQVHVNLGRGYQITQLVGQLGPDGSQTLGIPS